MSSCVPHLGHSASMVWRGPAFACTPITTGASAFFIFGSVGAVSEVVGSAAFGSLGAVAVSEALGGAHFGLGGVHFGRTINIESKKVRSSSKISAPLGGCINAAKISPNCALEPKCLQNDSILMMMMMMMMMMTVIMIMMMMMMMVRMTTMMMIMKMIMVMMIKNKKW